MSMRKYSLFSFPNFAEAIVGTITLTYLLLAARNAMSPSKSNVPENALYLWAVIVAAIYVISQELNVHSLGGNNIYDPYDLLFSIAGLVIAFVILLIIKPTFSP